MLTVSKVSALPGTLAANTMYLVPDGANGLQLTVTNSDGTAAKSTKTNSDIQSMINTAIINETSSIPVYAADITARDALTLTKNGFVLVADATADNTVTAGAALYFYDATGEAFIKVSEFESMDVTIPNAQILTDLSDVGGALYYKGSAIATVHNVTNEW